MNDLKVIMNFISTHSPKLKGPQLIAIQLKNKNFIKAYYSCCNNLFDFF